MDPLLMDDPALVAAIKALDLPADSPDDDRFNQRRTLAQWAEEEGVVLSPPDDSAVSPYAPPPEPVYREVPAEPAIKAATFFSLMFAGAAGAALVFHDRVLQILSTF